LERLELIGEIIRKARRRCLWNVALAQLVLSACFATGAAILVLLLGSQLLDWSWTLVALAAGLGFAAWRTAKRAPSPYRVAQLVDARLGLHDALSTAWFFISPGRRRYSEPMRDAQRDMAGIAAAQADPAIAVPIALPRNLHVLGAFALAAAGLFLFRVGMQRSLDLRAPITDLIVDTFSGNVSKRAMGQKNPLNQQRVPFDPAHPDTPTVEEHPEEPGTFDPAPDAALNTIDVPDVNNDKASGEKNGKAAGKGKGDEPGEESAEGEPGDGGQEGGAQQQAGAEERSAGANMKPDKGKPQGGPAVENPNLASKLRDAMSNLLSTLKPKQSNAGNKQSPQGQSAQDRGNPQAGMGQKGQSAQSQGKAGSEQAGDSQDGDAGDQAEAGKDADGKSSGKGSEERASHQPGSGMGKQDGSKDVKMAEQIEAMGKISEIIGKRSANVTGEATIEVQTTKQQIKTPYANNARAIHSQTSGEINRDEVPAASQQYVRQYFEKVRKPASSGASTAAKPVSEAAPPSGTDRTGR
jgi:hypothetical protein